MTVKIPALEGSATAPVDVSDAVFASDFNESLVHQLVVAYLAGARSGTKGQKSRSDVSGGGRKPWKQKGSGRARAGTTRGPLWRSGGVTFAATNRSYEQKLNKKMYRAGMRSIFSELLRQGRLRVCDEVVPAEPRTKTLLANMKNTVANRTVIITEAPDQNLHLAARNLPAVETYTCDALNPVALVNSDRVIITSGAAKRIEVGLA